MGSLSGTSAAGLPRPPAYLAAWSSSSGRAVARVPPSARSGTCHGVQPSAGSTKKSSSPLSLPLNNLAAPLMACRLAAVSWAVCPLPSTRYWVVTLSLWSWSMRAKLRVVRHGLPSEAVPGGGTVSFPALIAALAARKNATALQAPIWVNVENWPPMFCPATQLACCKIASGVPDAAGPSAGAAGGVAAVSAVAGADADADPDAGAAPADPAAPAAAPAVPAAGSADGDTDAGGDPAAGCDACADCAAGAGGAAAGEDGLLPERPLALLEPYLATRVRVAS